MKIDSDVLAYRATLIVQIENLLVNWEPLRNVGHDDYLREMKSAVWRGDYDKEIQQHLSEAMPAVYSTKREV